MLTRRSFLTETASALTALATPVPLLQPQVATRDVLICIFMRGGADGLNIVVPHGDADYYAARPALAIATPGRDKGAVDLDGFFGLHPALNPLQEIWNAKQLAVIHACGSPDPTHSHFDAMDNMERGVAGSQNTPTGWLGRHLAMTQQTDAPPLRAVGFGALLQTALHGSAASAITDLTALQLRANKLELPKLKAAHGTLYRGSSLLDGSGQEALATSKLLTKLKPRQYRTTDSAQYPSGAYGKALMQIAQLIKADVGVEVACADIGDWDTHVKQGGAEGEMANNLHEFAQGLRALYTDLAPHLNRLTVVTMSEFGRRVAENGGGGTDHGYGNVMFVLGGNVLGGKVYGQWPGLHLEQRYGPGDLAVTTDFRTVLGELLTVRLGNPALTTVFPNFQSADFLGVAQ